MNTIAISRLVGSQAGAIAKQVADALGYDLVDKEILQGTLHQYGLTRFGELYTSPPNFLDLANSKNLEIISMLNDTMKALAYRGNTLVLVRGGYVTLNEFDDVLNVRIDAPFKVRVDRVMAREGFSNPSEAASWVAADDNARMKFVQRFYGQKWHDARDFDLVLNTDVIAKTTAASWIIDAVHMLEARPPRSGFKMARDKKVDPLLLSSIDQAIGSRE
ncbi:cytidylate kinase-like family protein [Kiritimatiellaeota bacterium B1221]|nr:cytidylate kinase-like family protein [Kiritimatiellaeota bacterium B1221]